jgi:3-hydroxyacyl-CoA dehydrogenase
MITTAHHAALRRFDNWLEINTVQRESDGVISNKEYTIMIKEAVKSLPKGDETVKTIADQLRQEGIQIGEARAEARGIQSTIIDILQERFDVIHPVLAEKVKRVECKETLRGLFRQALKTESMQEFNRVVDRILQPL